MSEVKKAVWITGASSGIGKELALEFARNGEIVLATARKINTIESSKKDLGEQAENLIAAVVDITDKNAVKEFYKSISEKYSVSCLINNAGITSFKKAEQDSIEEIEKIISTNLFGSIYSIKTVLPDMITNNSGTIINLLSIVTKKIFTGSSAYSASKAGLMAYTNALREEVRKNNIRVINVSPGPTQTPIWPNSSLEKYSYRMMSPAEVAKLVYHFYKLKSNLVVEDISIRPIQGDL
jgi:NADP-dependent 3-hydroxy acid dehydrogenase YdfG